MALEFVDQCEGMKRNIVITAGFWFCEFPPNPDSHFLAPMQQLGRFAEMCFDASMKKEFFFFGGGGCCCRLFFLPVRSGRICSTQNHILMPSPRWYHFASPFSSFAIPFSSFAYSNHILHFVVCLLLAREHDASHPKLTLYLAADQRCDPMDLDVILPNFQHSKHRK